MLTNLEVTNARGALKPPYAPSLTRREAEQYSLARELLRILSGSGESGIERAYTEVAYRGPDATPFSATRAVVVPPEVVSRAMGLSPGGKGGFLSEISVDSPIGVLVLGQVSLVVRQIVGVFVLGRQLLTQAPQMVDRVLLQEGFGALATALDRAALRGGGGVEPLGILNVPGVPTVSGTTLGVVGLLSMQKTAANNNGLSQADAFNYVTTPSVAELLAQRATLGGGTAPVWSGALAAGQVLGCPAYATTNVNEATMIGGDFSKLLVAAFQDGIEIAVGNASFDAATVALRFSLLCDIAISNPEGFVISTSIT